MVEKQNGSQPQSSFTNTNANYGDFLNNIPSPVSSLFFSPTNDEEIADVFNTLKAGTACGYDDIKTDVVC